MSDKTIWDRAVAAADTHLPRPRLLIVLAHPDDEVLALGARLERLSESRILTLTDGAPADGNDAFHHGFQSLADYRKARHAELLAALAHAGVPADVAAPFSALPPVPDQRAAWHLEELTRGLLTVLGEFSPEAVLTHPYEGGHPDHDACAFVVHTALRIRRANPNEAAEPLLLEAPFYHHGENGCMRTGQFLPPECSPSLSLQLSPEEQTNKRARLACFRSQAETLSQFGTESESFRVAPAYDFSQPPHKGKLLYECYPWGMSGARFRTLASEAECHLPVKLSSPYQNVAAGQLS